MIFEDFFRKKFLLWSEKCGNPKLVHHFIFIFCLRFRNKISWAVTSCRTNTVSHQIHPPWRHESPLVVQLISQIFLTKMENKILSAEYQILEKILLVFLRTIQETKLLFWSFLKIFGSFQSLPKLFRTFQSLASNWAEIKTIVLRYKTFCFVLDIEYVLQASSAV